MAEFVANIWCLLSQVCNIGIWDQIRTLLKDLDEVGLYLPQARKSKEGEVGTFPEEGWAEVKDA